MQTSVTFLDALVVALARAGEYNKNDLVPPAAVLWPDKERQWEVLIPRLRERLPILTLGKYAPVERTGPAYWLRCAIAHTLPNLDMPVDKTPIIYLPGVSKQDLRADKDCPKFLQPIAELQYRGTLWIHKNGREWSIAAFLQTIDGGPGIEVGQESSTRDALQRALLKLGDESVESLRKLAPLRASFFDSLLNPDDARNLLLWLNNPAEYAKRCSREEWASFCQLCKSKYGFQPEQDGAVSGAQRLGERKGEWEKVWQRFEEAPQAYPNLPDLLRRARPQAGLFDYSPSWPQDNEAAEQQLRRKLRELREKYETDAGTSLQELENENAPRRSEVWAKLNQAPLAMALEHLAILASGAGLPLGGSTVSEIAAAYAEHGWRNDAAVLNALAVVENAEDVAAVKSAIVSIYSSWLEHNAVAFQKAIAIKGYAEGKPTPSHASIEPGTCVLFSDGLRFDIGQRLATMLQQRGFECQTDWHLAALPTVTPTAKPAISPVAAKFTGHPESVLEPSIKGTNKRVNADTLRETLFASGYQVLAKDEVGDPTGSAWTEQGAIDQYGHGNGWKIAHYVPGELRSLTERIQTLVNSGWKKVVIVTDHGWLLLPNGLAKSTLPEHLTDIRKGRCARLKKDAKTDFQTVPWHWDENVRIAMAPGITCFESGKEYEHGGLSPQECVVPIITVKVLADSRQSVEIKSVIWKGLRCAVTISGRTTDMRVDIRSKAGDLETSLVSPRQPDSQGTVSLLVENEELQGTGAFIVVVADDETIYKQELTTIGG